MENNFANFADMVSNDENLQPIMDVIEQIMAIPEDSLNNESIDVITGMISGAFTDKIRNASINEMIKNFEEEGLTREAVHENIESSKTAIKEAIDELKPSANKRQILESIFSIFYDIFDAALECYHNYNIVLPIKLDDGATVPTYAHETDACADLYAADDMVLPAHTFSNMVRTGVHIALPEGWMAMIFPRSSIGAKTQNRLSNSVGIIDSEYRGQLGVLYDNLSDSDYQIKAGDRVAQMLVMPSYKFKADVVDILPASDRGEGGFGSTGK